jgi:hypothetical protein
MWGSSKAATPAKTTTPVASAAATKVPTPASSTTVPNTKAPATNVPTTSTTATKVPTPTSAVVNKTATTVPSTSSTTVTVTAPVPVASSNSRIDDLCKLIRTSMRATTKHSSYTGGLLQLLKDRFIALDTDKRLAKGFNEYFYFPHVLIDPDNICNSGWLDKKEFFTAISGIDGCKTMSNEDMNLIFNNIDVDGDGKIDWVSFIFIVPHPLSRHIYMNC